MPDLQFFPESGRLVHGFGSKVAFKAIGLDGKGIESSGNVFDNQGNKVTGFKSNALGMGVFFLKADSLANYQAKVSWPSVKDSIAIYPLPKVVPKDTVLSVAKTNNRVGIALVSNVSKDSVYIKVSWSMI